jgi:hypothetical protein
MNGRILKKICKNHTYFLVKKVLFGSDTTWPKSLGSPQHRYSTNVFSANIEVNSGSCSCSETGSVSADLQPSLKIIVYFFPVCRYKCCDGSEGSPGCQKQCRKCGQPWGSLAGRCYKRPHTLTFKTAESV